MTRPGAILTIAAIALVTASCTTPGPSPTTPPPATSAPTDSPAADEPTELDVEAITAALNAGEFATLEASFADSVAYGSYGTESREPTSAADAVARLTEQSATFGPLVCPADPAVLDSLRPLLAESNLDWLPDDAITCDTERYVFSFVPEGATISGYYTIPHAAVG